MKRKSVIVLLIFVVIAGAIAGAFVFLSQIGAGGPSPMPGYSSSNGTAAQQELTQYEPAPVAYGADLDIGVCV